METAKKMIQMYRLSNGESPFEKWFSSLMEAKTKSIVLNRITRLRSGNLGDCKFIRNGVKEVRINYGPGYRIYFAEQDQKIIILICGGDKSTQQQDIEKAIFYWKNYVSK